MGVPPPTQHTMMSATKKGAVTLSLDNANKVLARHSVSLLIGYMCI